MRSRRVAIILAAQIRIRNWLHGSGCFHREAKKIKVHLDFWSFVTCDFIICYLSRLKLYMYLRWVISKKTSERKTFFFFDILNVSKESSRIGICKPVVRIRMSGSVPTKASRTWNNGYIIFVFSYRKRVKQRLIRIDECVETNNYSDSGILTKHLSASFLNFRGFDENLVGNSVVLLFVWIVG